MYLVEEPRGGDGDFLVLGEVSASVISQPASTATSMGPARCSSSDSTLFSSSMDCLKIENEKRTKYCPNSFIWSNILLLAYNILQGILRPRYRRRFIDLYYLDPWLP